MGKTGRFTGEEIEEVPLGHERNEFGVSGKVGEVGHSDGSVADQAGHTGDFGVGKLEELLEETELMEELESRGMDGVTAKVAEEVCVFFEDGDGNALTGEKEAEHDACRASADDAAGCGERVAWQTHGGLRVASERSGVKRIVICAERARFDAFLFCWRRLCYLSAGLLLLLRCYVA